MESSGKTLQAYIRQHPQVLKTLEQTGVYRVQKSHIEEKNGAISQYYLELYDCTSVMPKDWYPARRGRSTPSGCFWRRKTNCRPCRAACVWNWRSHGILWC